MNKSNDNARAKFYIDKTGFFAEGAMILLVLAAIFRIIGCWGMWAERIPAMMQIALPVCSCLLLMLCVLLLGKKGFFLSFIPVLLGVVFFVFRSLFFDNMVHTVLCILLYMVVAVVYTATVFGWIRTKWLLPPLFALPFLYHIIVEDLPALNQKAATLLFTNGMQEISVLCITRDRRARGGRTRAGGGGACARRGGACARRSRACARRGGARARRGRACACRSRVC